MEKRTLQNDKNAENTEGCFQLKIRNESTPSVFLAQSLISSPDFESR
jgi:hypothetical protein